MGLFIYIIMGLFIYIIMGLFNIIMSYLWVYYIHINYYIFSYSVLSKVKSFLSNIKPLQFLNSFFTYFIKVSISINSFL